MFTIRDKTLTISEKGIGNIMSIDRTTKAAGLQEGPRNTAGSHLTNGVTQTQA